MKRAFTGVSLLALLSSVAFGQSPTPTFDVADVHLSPRTTNTNPNMTGGILGAGRYVLRRATMVDLIRTAYGVDADKVVGGPSWLEMDRFDVIAKAPPSTPPETMKLMLQSLLADRFKLKVHNDNKTVPAFVLTVGKGKPKLKEAEGAGPPGCQPQFQNPQPGVVPYVLASCHNMTMEALAQNLRGMAGAYVTNPVVDSTGLKGSWDFDFKWTARGLLAQAGADGISIFDAVDKQLGLKLEPKELPSPVILVDSVNQKPSDNPPNVASLPSSPPAEFEVADIKPTMPGVTQQMARIQNGRLDVQAFPLKSLITLAWDINNDDLIAGTPKGLDSRYDIIAKASSAVAGPGNAQQADIDTLRLMLRALLVDRFKLKTHTEDRPVSVYTLLATKPKLTKADPTTRTGCKEGPAPASKDPRNANPVLSRLVTCQNMTMTQFADLLPSLAPGYIRTSVANATAVDGAWDFTFNFSPAGAAQGGGGRGGDAGSSAGAGGALAASEPSGALSLLDALPKQLGLKLEMQKRPMPVLVIDYAEEKPTD